MKPKQSFADWAASGDHTPKGVDPVEWDKKARKYAAGGMVGNNIPDGSADNNIPDMSDGGRIIDGPMYQAGGKVDGAAFGVFPQMKGKRSKQDREAAKNVPVDVARGFVSGALGMPGDIESLARLPYKLITGKESPTILPTSEDIEKRLPFRSDTPVSRAATGAGQIGGGFYTGPLSGAKAITAVPKAVMQAGKDFVQAAGQPAVNVIKPKGGNWLTGSVEKAVGPLKPRGPTDYDEALMLGGHWTDYAKTEAGKKMMVENSAINNWIDRNLTNYIKKEMATPEDPVRKLAEQGIIHTPTEQVGLNRFRAPEVRKHYGTEQLGQSEAARAWEDASDVAISQIKIKDISPELREPWMEKADPNTVVYHTPSLRSGMSPVSEMGFDHIVDVLRQDLSAGRIRPEQLNKVSMDQAVKRTYEFDQDMAKKMREAQIKATEGMPVHKEYPEGYKWIELTSPTYKQETLPPGFKLEQWDYKGKPVWSVVDEAGVTHSDAANSADEALSKFAKSKVGSKALEDALKYEGETMGHCVGGYCPDVLEGRSRIYSLRDAKGEPHVTVEVRPDRDKVRDTIETAYSEGGKKGYKTPDNEFFLNLDEAIEHEMQFAKNDPTMASDIIQIKGKQNKAPKPEYLPYVQDFVRGGQWSQVGDLQGTGLYHRMSLTPEERALLPKGTEYLTMDEIQKLREGKPWKPIDTDPELDINIDGMKKGGAVKPDCGCETKATGAEVKMQAGGIANVFKNLLGAAKTTSKVEKAEHPLIFPRAQPKTKEEIRPIAQRVAEQMTGEFVRQNPKVTTNPVGKSRKQFERERSLPMETRNVVPEKEVFPIDYEKFKDYAIVGVPGDPSMGGVAKAGSLGDPARATVELTRVGDITPDIPVPLFGGPRFGDEERFWASNIGAAKPVQSNVTELSEFYDAPVLGKYIKMAPDSANFAMHNLDALLSIQRPEQLSKGKLEQLNKLIRQGSPKYGKFPGFAGFDEPMDVLLQSQLNSNLRKHIAETLTKPTITEPLGLPSGLDVVTAITHPELRNLETGVSGFSIGRMTPGAVLKKGESAHPTYDTDIPGELIGRSKYPTPYEIAFPDTTAYARSQLKPGVQEFNMMKLLGPRERIDQQYIDEMKMFEELMKQYTGKKKGGVAKRKLPAIKKV